MSEWRDVSGLRRDAESDRGELAATVRRLLDTTPMLDAPPPGFPPTLTSADDTAPVRARLLEALGLGEDWQGDDDQLIAYTSEQVAQADYCRTTACRALDARSAAHPDSPGRKPVFRNVEAGLCPTCGRWRDHQGHLTGWDATEGNRFWELPRGHMPPDYTVDAATGWIPRYRACPVSPASERLIPQPGPVPAHPDSGAES